MSDSNADQAVFVAIDKWFSQAPAKLAKQDVIDWVQDNSEVACPRCGQWLWVMRGENAGGRGLYHLALCQNPDCDYQAAD